MKNRALSERRQGRRWQFADAEFDEDSWQLTVAGELVKLEVKPLELLHELLLHAGSVVSKEQLLDAVWPNVFVVEGSIATAIGKLRKALGDKRAKRPIIATVPRIGYRLTCEVACQSRAVPIVAKATPFEQPAMRGQRWQTVAAVLSGISALAAIAAGYSRNTELSRPHFSVMEVKTALQRLDQPKIDAMLRAGWKPDTPLDDQGNTALNVLLEVCEWNPDHDRQALAQVARTLIEGGAKPYLRNYWGDTAYSIAKAPRFCGLDHPATLMLRAVCVNTNNPADGLGDKCAADYLNSAAARNGGRAP